MFEPLACVVGAAEMREANQLEAHREGVTRLRMQSPIGPFDGLLVAPRGQMSKGEPGREQKGEWIERAQPYRLLLRLDRRDELVLQTQDPAADAPRQGGIGVERERAVDGGQGRGKFAGKKADRGAG